MTDSQALNKAPSWMNRLQTVLHSTTLKIFRPIVRILLRNGVPYRMASDILKQAYVEVAQKEFRYSGRKQTKSRISIMTGLSRVEVDRVLKSDEDGFDVEKGVYNRAARVITGWVKDADFQDRQGLPRDLSFDGEFAFSELVRRYSGGVPERALLDELVRVGVVEFGRDDRLRLKKHYIAPQSTENDLNKLAILGVSVSDLIETIDHNIYENDDGGRFQRIIFNQQIPAEALVKLREYIFEHGQQWSDEIDETLFNHSEPNETDAEHVANHRRAGIGIYYFES